MLIQIAFKLNILNVKCTIILYLVVKTEKIHVDIMRHNAVLLIIESINEYYIGNY